MTKLRIDPNNPKKAYVVRSTPEQCKPSNFVILSPSSFASPVSVGGSPSPPPPPPPPPSPPPSPPLPAVEYSSFNLGLTEEEALQAALQASLMDSQSIKVVEVETDVAAVADTADAAAAAGANAETFEGSDSSSVVYFIISSPGNNAQPGTSSEMQQELKEMKQDKEKKWISGCQCSAISRLQECYNNGYGLMMVTTKLRWTSLTSDLKHLTDHRLVCLFCAKVFNHCAEKAFALHLYMHCKAEMFRTPLHLPGAAISPAFSSGDCAGGDRQLQQHQHRQLQKYQLWQQKLMRSVVKSGGGEGHPNEQEVVSLPVRQWINLFSLMVRQYVHVEMHQEKCGAWCRMCAIYNPRIDPKRAHLEDPYEVLDLKKLVDKNDFAQAGEQRKAKRAKAIATMTSDCWEGDRDDDDKLHLPIDEVIDHSCRHSAYWRFVCNLCLKEPAISKQMALLKSHHFLDKNSSSSSSSREGVPNQATSKKYKPINSDQFNYHKMTGENENGAGCLFTVLTPSAVVKHILKHHALDFFQVGRNEVVFSRFLTVVAMEKALGQCVRSAGLSPGVLTEAKHRFLRFEVEAMILDLGHCPETSGKIYQCLKSCKITSALEYYKYIAELTELVYTALDFE